jgi:hypothetical protein
MQLTLVKEPFDSADWIFETKLDGYWAKLLRTVNFLGTGCP